MVKKVGKESIKTKKEERKEGKERSKGKWMYWEVNIQKRRG